MNIRDLQFNRYFLVVADGENFPLSACQSAALFAQGFEKGLALVSLAETNSPAFTAAAEAFFADAPYPYLCEACTASTEDLCALSERTESPMLFIEINPKGRFGSSMYWFKALRELRIPFVLTKTGMEIRSFAQVLVPVCYLVEEKEKGPYTANMGRFLKSHIRLLQARDYGTKAQRNVNDITALYDKFSGSEAVSYEVIPAKKDSFKVEREAAARCHEFGADMLVISTSRDYGLDDLIFGPKEQHVFRESPVPVMCINPRGDLYVLCW
ncbi:MAG: universal stress protein [Paludibacteraceae bacterium]|nr:universal stress protein [Paludibacteraceae bacterium]